MVKRYDEVFKREVVGLLMTLKTEGSVFVSNKVYEGDITTVRQLVSTLNISRDSLYTWAKAYGVVTDGKKAKRKPEQIKLEREPTYYGNPYEEDKNYSMSQAQKEALIPDLEFENNYEDWGYDEGLAKDQLIIRSEQRFLGFLASVFGIKNYGSLPKNQVYLKVGLALIKRSGLVNVDYKVLKGWKNK